MIAGVDEAGRGPVIGPMVMAIVATDDEGRLAELGVRDSKDLDPETRDMLAVQIKQLPYETISLEPSEIDAAVDGSSDNLNRLEARTTALLISRLLEREAVEKVIVDSPAKDGKKYEAVVRAELEGLTDKPVEIVCETKADTNYPVVGAASIIAKTTRDAALHRIREVHGDVGSGYPADPRTQAFLGKHWREGHDFFRKSWQSYKRLARGADQVSLSDFGSHAEKHAEVIKEFESLKEHGFRFEEPTNKHEIIRMRNGKTTIIRYATGKVVVQGPAREETETLLHHLGL